MTVALLFALAIPAMAAPSDMWITTKSKLALLTTAGVSGRAVSVDTSNQNVTLHGKVRSAEEKALAEATVRAIDGVTDVRNLLEVVPQAIEAAVEKSDAELKEHVTKVLATDSQLRNSDVRVKSVDNGSVLLSGTAKTMTEYLTAVEVASAVPGVRHVASEIEGPDGLSDAEIWRERADLDPDAEYGFADASRDMWITSMVKMSLIGDSRTPALDINVDTRMGHVTLFGIVPSDASKKAAEEDARKVNGVRGVENALQVVAHGKQEAVKSNDVDIKRAVTKAFQSRDNLKNINIEVMNCVVRLTGNVPSGTQRLEAATLARATAGVCSIEDGLILRAEDHAGR